MTPESVMWWALPIGALIGFISTVCWKELKKLKKKHKENKTMTIEYKTIISDIFLTFIFVFLTFMIKINIFIYNDTAFEYSTNLWILTEIGNWLLSALMITLIFILIIGFLLGMEELFKRWGIR